MPSHDFYQQKPFADQLPHLAMALDQDLGARTVREIPSSGYVVDTLTAGLWCLLTSKDYPETVLKAVNLGGDTDTTGIVAGGLAGVYHGLDAVPERWRLGMARATDLESLFSRFVGLFA